METEERIGIEEIEKYMPIPKGGFHLVTSYVNICLMLCAGAVCLSLSYCTMVMGLGSAASTWIFAMAFAFFAFIFGWEALKAYHGYFPRGMLRWLREYWDKNVKGWSLYYYTEQAPHRRMPYREHEEPVHAFIGRPDLWPEDFPFQDSIAPALEVPMGGWNSTAKYHRGHGWRIKKVFLNKHNVLLNIKGTDGGWSVGKYTPEKILLHHEDFIGVHSLGKHAVNLLCNYDRLMDDHIEECHKRLRFESLTRELHEEKLETISDLEEVIEAISNTSRLGKSKEARRIREEILIPALLKLLSEDDPRRKKYETKAA